VAVTESTSAKVEAGGSKDAEEEMRCSNIAGSFKILLADDGRRNQRCDTMYPTDAGAQD
uniref:Uncharacterized protein n=1 Tax=Oryza glaberrima TaxID=4538 RepID=I1Q246_ORYGL